MFTILQIVLFIVLCATAGFLAYKGYNRVYKNIMLGKSEDLSGDSSERLKNMLLVAFGQKKMFKNITPAVLHLFIYVGFVITQIELIEIFIDGLTGSHRIIFHAVEDIAPLRFLLYVFTISFIEVVSVFVFVATVAFLSQKMDIESSAFKQTGIERLSCIGCYSIIPAIRNIFAWLCIFSMNTADMALHNGEYGFLDKRSFNAGF
jgi:hypothetical protein